MTEQNVSGENQVTTEGAAPEKMLRQSEVNAIAARTKQEGYDKAMREMAAQYGTQQAQTPQAQPAPLQPQQQPQQQPMNSQASPQLTPDQVRQMIMEHAPQSVAQQQQAQQRAGVEANFIQKLEAGKTPYPDFDQKVYHLDLAGKNRDMIPLLNSVDNAADVMNDIADNPKKLVELRALAMSVSPQAAFNEMRKLSDSIKQNQSATQERLPNEPLSQVNTSITGADSGSLKNVTDFRNAWASRR